MHVALYNLIDKREASGILEPFIVRETVGGTSDLVLQLLKGSSPAQPDGIVVRNGSTIAVRSNDTFWLRDQYGSVVVASDDFSVWKCWSRSHELVPEVFSGNRWLMLALWGYLTLRGGAYLHGAACVMGGRYVLFLGDSGVGKSTLSKLVVAAGGTCLTDENPFVTAGMDGRPQVHGSTRPGVNGPLVPLSGTLDAVFFLRHAPENDLRRLNGSAIGRRLVGNARFFHWMPETIPLTMTMLDVIASNTLVFDFGFIPDDLAPAVVKSVLGQCN